MLNCRTSHKIEEIKKTDVQDPIIEKTSKSEMDVFIESQPKYPVETDDSFFLNTTNILDLEVFRVLITKHNYQVRQINYKENIERIEDVAGDKEQLKIYEEIYNQIDFKDWVFEGVIRVKINPQTNKIENLKYESVYIPKTQQAAKLFMEDISRYKFRFLKSISTPNTFLIRMQWRIQKNTEITEEQAKERAIEYLKKYVQ
ncbi:MAG: hypothetical protein ACK4UJ_04815 [Leptonema sp. (in: bacteria)]